MSGRLAVPSPYVAIIHIPRRDARGPPVAARAERSDGDQRCHAREPSEAMATAMMPARKVGRRSRCRRPSPQGEGRTAGPRAERSDGESRSLPGPSEATSTAADARADRRDGGIRCGRPSPKGGGLHTGTPARAARRRSPRGAETGERRGDSVSKAEPEGRRPSHRNARSSRHATLACCERRVAERAGFEPAVRFPVHTLSKRAP